MSLEFQKNLYVPHPENRPGNLQNFQNLTGTEQDDNQFTVRVDHHFNDKNLLFGRYSWANNDQLIPAALPAVVESRYNHFRNYVINYNLLLSPTTIFEFKHGYNEDDIQRRTPRLGSGVPGLVAAGLKGIPESGTFRETFEYPVSLNIQGFAAASPTGFCIRSPEDLAVSALLVADQGHP